MRLIIKKLPMMLWTMEGITDALGDKVIIDRLDRFEHADTKTFMVWAWVLDLGHIPMRHMLWKHARGAGRVEEIFGFSPPSRQWRRRSASRDGMSFCTWTASRTGRPCPRAPPTLGRVQGRRQRGVV
ncbi:D-3-phosphoglycerate dehydrogenase, chloroplastic [Hordeum vulgare]|nr:D-3-phosphoglycerate dehydrogenase, chloroplastic [Hordeum vulgare]